MSDFDGLLLIILGFVLLIGVTIFASNSMSAIGCDNEWSSFDHQYTFWGGCRLKLDNRWIPSDQYYYKQGK